MCLYRRFSSNFEMTSIAFHRAERVAAERLKPRALLANNPSSFDMPLRQRRMRTHVTQAEGWPPEDAERRRLAG